MVDVGIRTITGRHGQPLDVLSWNSGTRSGADGHDLPAVAKRLTNAQLVFWAEKFRDTCFFERNILLSELARRRVSAKPSDSTGQLVLF